MYAYGVTENQLKELAESCGFIAETEQQGIKTPRVKFTLRNNSPEYHSRGYHNSDLKTKVCFHGHYVFLSELFNLYPNARVTVSWYKVLTYTADNFSELAEDVGNTVVRQYDQLRVRDKCDCES